MIFTIDDAKIQKMIVEELAKVGTRATWGDSAFEKAVKLAVFDLVKEQVTVLIKANPGQFDALKTTLEEEMSTQLAALGKKLATIINAKINDGLEQAFKTYDD